MVDARSCFVVGFFPLSYLFVFGWGLFLFFPPFLFSSNYLCMDISVRNHSKVYFSVVQMFPLITENTSFPKLQSELQEV